MEHGPQKKRQTLANINFTTETTFSSFKFQKQKADAYLHRYSKDSKNFKEMVFLKIQKYSEAINNCPLSPSQKIIVTINGVFNCCHYFEHLPATQIRLYQQFTTV